MKHRILLAAALCLSASFAQAEVVTNTITFNDFRSDDGTMYAYLTGSGDFSLDALADGQFTFEMWNWEVAPASLYFDIAINGVSLGRLYDSNPGNDDFNAGHNGDDVGKEFQQNYLSTSIDMVTLNTLLDSGAMTLAFTPSAGIQRYWIRDAQIEYTISSPESSVETSPVSAPITLSALAMIGMAGFRRKQKSAQ